MALVTRFRSRSWLCAALLAASILAFGSPAWSYQVLTSGGDNPGVQKWIAGIDDLNTGEVFVPIELDLGDPQVAYLNVAINFNGDALYAPYLGTGGPQDEWVIVNLPIEIPSGPGHYHGAWFALTDAAAKSGVFQADIWVTPVPMGFVSPGSGTFTGSLPMQTFDRDQFGPPSTAGPSGSSLGSSPDGGEGRPAQADGAVTPFGFATSGGTRALPERKQQVDSECFITSVAMSMKWLESKYPTMFPAALPAINDLVTAMKTTAEWTTYNIIRWGHLSEWKGTIFKKYDGKVTIHKWNGTDDAYTWMKGQLDAGEDVEMSMGYKPVANNDGHSVILTGWTEDGTKTYVKAVDPLEPNKNGKQFDKSIRITGSDTDYPSRNGTVIREIDAESPAQPTPTRPTTWGRMKSDYR